MRKVGYTIGNRKVAIIGAGYVGSSIAYAMALRDVVLIISSQVDILNYKAAGWMCLSNGMVFGSGNILDSSRFVRTIADYVGLSKGAVNAYIVGECGDGRVPVWIHVTVGGIPIAEYCEDAGLEWNNEVKREIADKTKNMGEHGCRGVALSVPSVVDLGGVRQRIHEKWILEEYRGVFRCCREEMGSTETGRMVKSIRMVAQERK